MRTMNREDQMPTHAMAVTNGRLHESHTRESSMMNTVVGPVVRSTISGCPASRVGYHFSLTLLLCVKTRFN